MKNFFDGMIIGIIFPGREKNTARSELSEPLSTVFSTAFSGTELVMIRATRSPVLSTDICALSRSVELVAARLAVVAREVFGERSP